MMARVSPCEWTSEEDEFCLAHPELSSDALRDALGATHGGADVYRKHRKTLQLAHASGNELGRLGRVADLLEKNGIDLDEVGKVEKVRLNDWQGLTKNKDGEAEIHELEAASILFTPKWAEGPDWPVIAPAPPIVITALPATRRVRDGMDRCVILPDPQIGYYRDNAGELIPTHDEQALSLALQITRDVMPDRVILIGDVLDFPELGKYRREPAFARTTQQTIDRATKFIADLRANVPRHCSIEWIEGNHEVRLQNYIKDNAAAAYGLKPGNTPDSWPVLSVPVLCRLDELGAIYHPGYPATVVWLSDRLKVIHGDKASMTGDAKKYLTEERVSLIAGHSHRREWSEQTRDTRNGPRTILAALPGCLCRIDGRVPSRNSGTDLDGLPLESWQNWQQGLAVVSYEPGNGPFALELVPIHHGQAWWRGSRYDA